MKRTTSIVAVSLILFGNALAGVMDVLAENTLKITFNGEDILEHYNADGTYSSNQGSSGTWTYEGGILCTDDGENEFCGQLPEGAGVGDKFSITLTDGTVLAVEIIKGR